MLSIAKQMYDYYVKPYLAEGGDIDRCLKEVHDMILRIRPSAKVECKIGVYELHGETLNPDLALASVKIACDSIRNTPDTFMHITRIPWERV